ncbi:GD15689 [Drosophila simulans]|uniref:GD15689 n=1 Tax=Drosophila simulans TaxID=7240 RepID=B4R6E7_DROSI|nr:GD15689 [Drosophila simulans]
MLMEREFAELVATRKRGDSARRVDEKWGPPNSKAEDQFSQMTPALRLHCGWLPLNSGEDEGGGGAAEEVAVSVECQMNGNRQLASGICSRNQMKSNGPVRRQR